MAEVKITGKVNWFNVAKGFGFITRDDGEGDVFVHQSDLHAEGFRSLREGETVEFAIETSEDGRAKAISVSGPEGSFVQGAPRRVSGPGRNRGGRGSGEPREGGGGGRGEPRAPRAPKTADGEEAVSSGLQVVVLNLPWSVTWQTLKDSFASLGSVSRADVVLDDTGRSRGFGTVRFETPEEAQAAVEAMNNTEIDGRVITVRIDRYG